MRLAIVAFPSWVLTVALALTSVLTLEIAFSPTQPPQPRTDHPSGLDGCWVRVPDDYVPPPTTCSTAHTLLVRGHVSGGASHVKLAGPILYTDVATNFFGDFELRVPVDGNVCDLLTQPTHYVFGQDVSYTITFE